ncbi:unnamed protein product [Prorocentrum cordatum]|uniref:Phospholipase B-like n=1 Tax=Prorocentrum cordatum TaxID=2364126 RepID=A0ABN9WQX2_9DINO|nr:unnamed protein product [Polarella glacialis]
MRPGLAGLLAASAAYSRACGAAPAQHELLRYDVDLEALPDLFGSPGLAGATAAAWLDTLRRAHPAAAEELAALSAALLRASPSEPLFELPALAVGMSLYPLLNIAAKNTTDARPSACTSALARMGGGRVLHGRSLDYEPRDPLALGSVVLDFRLRGEVAYRCLHPLPYGTALQWFTCVRPGAFSLSVNARSQGSWTEHNTSFPELLRRLEGSLLLGEVAEVAMATESYAAALAVLASAPAVSSNYFILAGAGGEGAVVTRFGNTSSADVWALGSSPAVSNGQPPWMRVQTNVDHWVSFTTGDYATHRRQRAIDELSAIGAEALDRDAFMRVYLTDSARPGSENRTRPEDTGVLLGLWAVATVILDPAAPFEAKPDPRYWRVWAESPTIGPPPAPSADASVALV